MLSGGVPPWSGSGRASALQDDSVECPRVIMLLLAFMVIAATRLRATSRNGSLTEDHCNGRPAKLRQTHGGRYGWPDGVLHHAMGQDRNESDRSGSG
jgi:hypothetical protein